MRNRRDREVPDYVDLILHKFREKYAAVTMEQWMVEKILQFFTDHIKEKTILEGEIVTVYGLGRFSTQLLRVRKNVKNWSLVFDCSPKVQMKLREHKQTSTVYEKNQLRKKREKNKEIWDARIKHLELSGLTIPDNIIKTREEIELYDILTKSLEREVESGEEEKE